MNAQVCEEYKERHSCNTGIRKVMVLQMRGIAEGPSRSQGEEVRSDEMPQQ